ncbi:PQQ-binding-like beta-propeller repeat protein [Micromonospora sp. NPDC049089]|uniref:outer membrane protein assembly factor BamB family protein n=1 Tax=Micromonospora sp. NPDC049089 TaxID=3155496 RepID=UPI0033F7BC40
MPSWTVARTRRFRTAIYVAVLGLVGAGLAVLMVPHRGPSTTDDFTGSAAESAASRGPLPVGGLQVSWDLPVGDFHAFAIDQATGSIGLTDFATGLDETARVQIVDADRGFVRWRRQVNADWLLNRDGTLSSTVDGTGFLAGRLYSGEAPVSAVRLADGRSLWQADPDTGWSPHLVGDVVVLQTDTVISALDAHSGAARWQWRSSGACGDRLHIDYGARPILVVNCTRTVHTVAASDGSTRWTWTTPDGCRVYDTAASEMFIGVVATCRPGEQRLYVLDGTSGAERWSRALPWDPDAADPADPTHGALKPSMATLDDDAVFEIRGDDVERFTALTGAKLPLDVGAGTFVGTAAGNLIYRSDDDGATLSAMDPQTGARAWRRPLPLTSVKNASNAHPVQHAVGDRLYLIGSVDGLWPSVLTLVDARTGDMTASAAAWVDADLVGVGPHGTVYAAYGPYDQRRLTAVRVTGQVTGYLGTAVRADDWPDACRLLSAARYRSAFGVAPVVRPIPLDAPGATLPKPSRCRYLPPSIEGTEVTVEVNWLSETADDAPDIASQQGMRGGATTAAVGEGRHTAWRWDETNTGVDRVPRIRLSFAVGRCVASVTTLGRRNVLPAIGGIVADNLADHAVSPGCAAPRR